MEKAKRVDVGFWGSLIMANFTENIYLSIIWLVLAFYYLINSFKQQNCEQRSRDKGGN